MLETKFQFWILCICLSIISITYTFPTGNDACEGMIRVNPNFTRVTLPLKYANRELPWSRRTSSFLYKGNTLTYNWNWFKELKIQGLDTTLNGVIQLLDQQDCYFVAYGKGVKNIIIGAVKDRSLLEISGETTCDAFKIYEICEKHFGNDNCGTKPMTKTDEVTMGNSNVMKMFDEAIIGPVTIYSWGSTFENDRLKWSFSVNHGGIFDDGFGTTRFIDVSGQSQHDICHKRIEIPLQPTYWEAWCAESFLKTLEFYNLVADGFAANQNLHQYLIASIIKSFNQAIFQKYYCNNVLGGEYTPAQTLSYQRRNPPLCRYLAPDARRKRLIGIINTQLHEDFGDFWHNTVTKSLSDMYQSEVHGKPQRRINISFNYDIREHPYDTHRNYHNRQPYYPPPPPPSPITPASQIYYPNNNYNNNQYPVNHNNQQERIPVIDRQVEAVTAGPHEVKHYGVGEYPRVLSQDVPEVPDSPTVNPPKPIKPLPQVSDNTPKENRDVRYYSADEIPRTLATDYD